MTRQTEAHNRGLPLWQTEAERRASSEAMRAKGAIILLRRRRADLFPELVAALKALLKDAESLEPRSFNSVEEADNYNTPASFAPARAILAKVRKLEEAK